MVTGMFVAIVRYHLFNFKVVAAEVFAGLIVGLVLVVLAFGNENVAAHITARQKPQSTALMHTGIFISVLLLLMVAYYGIHRMTFGY